jgi:putative ABC transport system permease protein
MIADLLYRLRALFRRSSVEAELDDELRFHFEREAAKYVAAGLSPEESRRRARLALGGIDQVREDCRQARGVSFLENVAQDIRFSLRMLRRSPGFTTIAVLTLALGIGANTAIFSVINCVLLKPLPFKAPALLVSLRETESAPGNFPLDGADYIDWQAQNKTFASMSLYSFNGFARSFSATGAGVPESAAVVSTQANFFDTLGVQPLAGRLFAQGEDAAGKDHVMILSYAFWQRHFAGQPSALGKTVQLNGEPYTLIGVMPPWFNFPAATDLWIPFDMTIPLMHNRGSHWANALGRVKEGVSIEQARADLLSISQKINEQFRKPDDRDIHSLVFPLKERLVGDSRSQLMILLGAVTLVLVVACANIANLLLARSTGRQREMAVRAALGAGRWRLAHQLLTESILLSLAGAAVGLLAAWWGVSLLRSMESSPIPQVNPVHVDVTVLLFTVAVSIIVGVLFGLAPALQFSGLNVSEELKSSATAVVGTTGSGRTLRSILIVSEIAVSLALLIGAGLLLRTFAHLHSADIGVRPENVLTMRLNLPEAKYKTSPDEQRFFDDLMTRTGQIPGVLAAAASTEIALDGGRNGYVSVPGNTNAATSNQLVEQNYITQDYFRTFGIHLLSGRTFTSEDMQRTADFTVKVAAMYKTAKDPATVKVPPDLAFVVVINQAMAKMFWANQDPIGKTFTGQGGGPLRIVIGVVSDEKQEGIRQQPLPENYFPLTQTFDEAGASATISVKTAVPSAAVLNPIRGTIRGLDASLAVFHVRTMDEVIAENMQDTTLQTFLLAVFAALALTLAAVGLYGVMSYLVKQRTHEIGIRMALGAGRGDLLKLVIGQGAKLIFTGLGIGIAVALLLTRLISAMLFGVTATDPATFLGVAVLLTLVALLACYIPARRAMHADPVAALRYE